MLVLDSSSGAILLGGCLLERAPSYPPTIHLLWRGLVIASQVPERKTSDGWGFELPLDTYRRAEIPASFLTVLVAESGEILHFCLGDEKRISLTEAALMDHRPASEKLWGATFEDALRLGYSDEEIIHLFYVDYFQRLADDIGLNAYVESIRSGTNTYNTLRRLFLTEPEYLRRTPTRDTAPGKIFNSRLVSAAAARRRALSAPVLVAAEPFDGLSPELFVMEAFKVVLGREPSSEDTEHFTDQIARGAPNSAVLEEIATSYEAALRLVLVK
jgi:hypothetical protein